jgi:diacylglycerol kinase family enzyme
MSPRLVLINPSAAGGRAGVLAPQVRAWLRSQAVPVPLIESKCVAQALATLDGLPPASRVVLVGGDGSVHRMLPMLLARGHTLGLVPMGSGNDCARALRLHRLSWREALAWALSGPARRIDTGELRVAGASDSIPFVSSLAAGFDAAVARRATAAPRWLRGMPRYLAATLAELSTLRHCTVRVTADGRAVHAGPAIFASTLNTSTYGAGMPAVPLARTDDARLDLLVAGAFGRLGALGMLPLLATGRHLRHPRVTTLRFAHLQLESDRPLSLAADGEPLAPADRFEVQVRPASLSVVAGAAR